MDMTDRNWPPLQMIPLFGPGRPLTQTGSIMYSIITLLGRHFCIHMYDTLSTQSLHLCPHSHIKCKPAILYTLCGDGAVRLTPHLGITLNNITRSRTELGEVVALDICCLCQCDVFHTAFLF